MQGETTRWSSLAWENAQRQSGCWLIKTPTLPAPLYAIVVRQVSHTHHAWKLRTSCKVLRPHRELLRSRQGQFELRETSFPERPSRFARRSTVSIQPDEAETRLTALVARLKGTAPSTDTNTTRLGRQRQEQSDTLLRKCKAQAQTRKTDQLVSHPPPSRTLGPPSCAHGRANPAKRS
jgi:hypothetical protein